MGSGSGRQRLLTRGQKVSIKSGRHLKDSPSDSNLEKFRQYLLQYHIDELNLESLSARRILLLPPYLVIRGQAHAANKMPPPCIDLLSSWSTSRSRQERSPLTSFNCQHLEHQENLHSLHGYVFEWTVDWTLYTGY